MKPVWIKTPSKVDKLDDIMNPSDYIGRAPEQVERFIKSELEPVVSQFVLGGKAELSV